MNTMPNKKIKLLLFPILILLLISSMIVRAEDEKIQMLKVILEVSSKSNCINLIYKNNTEEDLYLTKWDAVDDGELSKDLFEVAAGSKSYRYGGVLLKLPEPEAKDLVKVPALGSVTSTVNVLGIYDIDKAQKEVEIWFDATIPIYSIVGEKAVIKDFETLISSKVKLSLWINGSINGSDCSSPSLTDT